MERKVLISDLGFVDVTGFSLSKRLRGEDIVFDIGIRKAKFAYSKFEIYCDGHFGSDAVYIEDLNHRVGADVDFDKSCSGFDVYMHRGWNGVICEPPKHRPSLARRVLLPLQYEVERGRRVDACLRSMRKSW